MTTQLLTSLFIATLIFNFSSPLAQSKNLQSLPLLDHTIKPFRNIGKTLGKRAETQDITPNGLTLFDANGDGRLDIFLPHPQRTTAKQTTSKYRLTSTSTPAIPHTLFLNMGNKTNGDPIYKSVQELLKTGNNRYTRSELIIEGKYRPRQHISDDENTVGRIAWGAVSADFNGDGRVDLYVLNGHYGVPYTTEDTGFKFYPGDKNLGRNKRLEKTTVKAYPFQSTDLSDGLHVTLNYGHIPEAEGRNSLYLNLGDNDGDGIPEWEDATLKAGVGGHWHSVSASVIDYDRDGDLDLYVANFVDPDFLGFHSTNFPGNANQLYKNLLNETGTLRFIDVAVPLKVAGYHNNPDLFDEEPYPDIINRRSISNLVIKGKQIGERADHSWASVFHDFNNDNWPDLVVANDLGGTTLRVYENIQGHEFRYLTIFNSWEAPWMGMSVGDLDGDQIDDLIITNVGSGIGSVNRTFFQYESQEPNTTDTFTAHIKNGLSYPFHVLLHYDDKTGFSEKSTTAKVHHSPYIRPDFSLKENVLSSFFESRNYASSLAGLEFSWNAPMLDVDNDGDLDLYFVGSLGRGNDLFWGDDLGSPGRLLVNQSRPGVYEFVDRTLEYQLLDISNLDYTHNPPRRKAPGTGWHKRDYVYLDDTDGYQETGLQPAKANRKDIFRLHEHAYGALSGDLNGDGFPDLVVTHAGGYDSNLPNARNLQIKKGRRLFAVPAKHPLLNPPTNFEPGPTFVYINQGPPRGEIGHWIKIQLQDTTTFNRYGIGSKVTVNDRIMRRMRATSGAAFGSTHENLLIGLGKESLKALEIIWGSGSQEKQFIHFKKPIQNQTIYIDRLLGVLQAPFES